MPTVVATSGTRWRAAEAAAWLGQGGRRRRQVVTDPMRPHDDRERTAALPLPQDGCRERAMTPSLREVAKIPGVKQA